MQKAANQSEGDEKRWNGGLEEEGILFFFFPFPSSEENLERKYEVKKKKKLEKQAYWHLAKP